MQRRYNLTHFILVGLVVLGLTLLMVCVDAQAQIAFASERNGNPEIYVMDINGKNQHRLTNNASDDWSPSWSPDGKHIVFTSERDGNKEIYVMEADGSNPRRLTENDNFDQSPSWSPDGERITFMSDRDGDFAHFDIFVMDADGGNQQNITNNPFDERHPSWSPDGKRIVFSSHRDRHFRSRFGITSEIYVMDADGGNQQRLTKNRKNDWFPSWSPDGERIAFAADRKGDFANFEIYAIDANGGNQRRLTENRVDDWSPSWSPDGERITFSSRRDGNREIYVMDANGGNQQNLTNNPHDDWYPSWFNSPFFGFSRRQKVYNVGTVQTGRPITSIIGCLSSASGRFLKINTM